MKRLLFSLSMAVAVTFVHAQPPVEWSARKRTLHSAQELISSGRTDEAVRYLQTNLKSRGNRSQTVEVAYGLAEIAWQFQNQRKLTTARSVATEALDVAGPILKRRNPSADEAELLGNLGFLCDEVLNSPSLAQPLYESALAARPDDTATANRLKELKLKESNRRGNGGE